MTENQSIGFFVQTRSRKLSGLGVSTIFPLAKEINDLEHFQNNNKPTTNPPVVGHSNNKQLSP